MKEFAALIRNAEYCLQWLFDQGFYDPNAICISNLEKSIANVREVMEGRGEVMEGRGEK